MDAMCYPMVPRYETVSGVVAAVDQVDDMLHVTVRLPCGGRTSAPGRELAWSVGQPVEVLVHRTPFGRQQALAVRLPAAA